MERARGKGISGDDAFKLKDTYGFPLEEIELIAKDEGMGVDLKRFAQLEEEAKEKSRKAHKKVAQEFDANFFNGISSVFDGYTKTTLKTKIARVVVGGKFVDLLPEGEMGMVVLETTPFYAEMGGQVGDTGVIRGHGLEFDVQDTTSPFPGVVVHLGKMVQGALRVGAEVVAAVDEKRREDIERSHTATHLLHLALQEVLGPHVKQAGSLVEAERLRFDFNHHKALGAEELRDIEEKVNGWIRTNQKVNVYELSYQEAQGRSDIKQFFGEKYGSKVRVVDIDFSKELCGGTHVDGIGKIGFFKITRESSIAAGVRRIEAVCGQYAEKFVQEEEHSLQELVLLVGSVEKAKGLIEENKRLEQEIRGYRKKELKALLDKCLLEKEAIGGGSCVIQEVPLLSEEMAPFAEEVLQKIQSGVVALGSASKDKCQLLIAVSSDFKHLNAQTLIKEVAPLIQGGGGGKPNLAQAGGKDPLGLPKAIEKLRTLLKNRPLS
jgi:alanyl-tRNA synthetase